MDRCERLLAVTPEIEPVIEVNTEDYMLDKEYKNYIEYYFRTCITTNKTKRLLDLKLYTLDMYPILHFIEVD